MKLDNEFLKNLLLQIEENQTFGEICDDKFILGNFSLEEAYGHLKSAKDNGLIQSLSYASADDTIAEFAVGGLTMEGFKFLEKIKNKKIWDKVKELNIDNLFSLINIVLEISDK